MCKVCGRKQYSTARLSEQRHPECVYCGAPKQQIFEVGSEADPSMIAAQANKPTATGATGAANLDGVIIAAHKIHEYCCATSCSEDNICPIGHMLGCYEDGSVVNLLPAMWDIPEPFSIGINTGAEGGVNDGSDD